jgi:hypothetical protein
MTRSLRVVTDWLGHLSNGSGVVAMLIAAGLIRIRDSGRIPKRRWTG